MKIELNLTDEQFRRMFTDNTVRTDVNEYRGRDKDGSSISFNGPSWNFDCSGNGNDTQLIGKFRGTRSCDTLVNMYHRLREVREAIIKSSRRSAVNLIDDLIDDLDNVLSED